MIRGQNSAGTTAAITAHHTVSGSILANGGTGGTVASYVGGCGAGGAIHLQAPTGTGTGTIRADGGTSSQWWGGSGRIRIDSVTYGLSGTISPAASRGAPFNTPLPTSSRSVKLVSVNGVSVPAYPAANFVTPDLTINSATAVNISIAGSKFPLGTVVKLYLASKTGGDQVITCSGLSGSVANSTATCSAVFPLGVSATLAPAVW